MAMISTKTGGYIGLGVLVGFGVFMIFLGSIFTQNMPALVDNGWNIVWVGIIITLIKMTFDFFKDRNK